MIINEKQFLDFYDKHIAKIYRYIYFRVGSQEIAQDLSSEVFLRVWNYLRQGQNIGNLTAMAYKISRNLIVDHFRKLSVSFPLSLEALPLNLPDPDSGDFAADIFQDLELAEIKNCLRLINPDYQEVIILRFVEDMSIEEIAVILGKNQNAVRTTLSRALKALKLAVESQKAPQRVQL
jgi:RNA polymerase sigma-70 factor (ECF subfamily)